MHRSLLAEEKNFEWKNFGGNFSFLNKICSKNQYNQKRKEKIQDPVLVSKNYLNLLKLNSKQAKG